ncbi:hypothetical protein Taro_051175 [Colocasia esculenta]|uniref:Uncharacterized protein n=1 Tax=Colocasia esculenta TaxID=4460 RepID=A0A843XG37_COLES|nr:hypothetical protein [Colocasia esculenta]
MRKQPSAHTRRDKKLTEHRSNHVRPESHDTSTSIPDLHKVGKEQPGEKERLTTTTATSNLHKVEGPQAEPLCTSDTPRGQGTTPSNATVNGTKEQFTEPAPPTPAYKLPGRVRRVRHDREHNTRTTAAWPSCGPTPNTTTWLRNQRRERQRERTSWLAPERTPQPPRRHRPSYESSTND